MGSKNRRKKIKRKKKRFFWNASVMPKLVRYRALAIVLLQVGMPEVSADFGS